MKKSNTHLSNKPLMLLLAIMSPFALLAQAQDVSHSSSYFSNALFNTLLVVILLLGIMVVALGGALKNVINSDFFIEKQKKEGAQKKTGAAKNIGLLLLFMFMNQAAFSQEKIIITAQEDRIGGLDQVTFYTMLTMIGLEILVLGVLFNVFKSILGTNQSAKTPAPAQLKTKSILDKLNDTVELEKEEDILLDHDYDGIKELDNNLPPWWKYGFYLTILVAVVYLINYHITKTAPLQKDEYTRSIKKAELEIAEYMKHSANNVDETTVKLLTDAADLAAGQDLFIATCAPCHGRLGEGTVGPNLTDNYWLHGGGIKDVFKTIKYGWPDKGMKSWKDDFSPIQIAQIASFIHSLQGTNPPKPKDKQGELYIEQNTPSDSAAVIPDTTAKALASELPKEL